jgi:quinol monooxygenase YgiN
MEGKPMDGHPLSEQVSWQVELAVKPGQLEKFRALTREMVEFTRKEPGALIYERYISADGSTVYVYERYADSAAAVAHLREFARVFGAAFSALVERRRFTVFGAPSDELKSILDGFDATYHALLDGFSLA